MESWACAPGSGRLDLILAPSPLAVILSEPLLVLIICTYRRELLAEDLTRGRAREGSLLSLKANVIVPGGHPRE